MAILIPVGIAGIGAYVPEAVLTNADLEQRVDTSDEWITQRTGIKQRRIAAAHESCSTISVRAARAALADAGMDAAEIDLVLCCTVTGDQPFPATACRVGHDIGAARAGGWDLTAACSGFIYGLQTAAGFVASGMCKNVLVIGAEILSRILDYEDRNTCVLFGDGAGAAVVTPLGRAGRAEFLGGGWGMDGGQEGVLCVPGGGSRHPASADTVQQRMHFMKMGGAKVFRFAVKVFADTVEDALKPYGYDQLGLVVPHQVNQRIIEAAAERIDLPMTKFFTNIDRYGNTSAASIPIAMTEAIAGGRMEKGKIVCLVAFGAGMSWGHALLRW